MRPDTGPPPAEAKATLRIGDRLKIAFFELIDLAGGAGSRRADAAAALLQTGYQRMDLSGEFEVGEDGAITLPRLGRFEAHGREQQQLQADLVAAFAKAMGRQADATITIVDRSPVYVVGLVKNQGAYKYVPGMMVLHAVALAGGLDRGQGDPSQMIESVRERERSRKAANDLKRLLALRARLDAERRDASTLEAPPQLMAIAGKEGAQLFLGAESANLAIEQAKRRQQATELAGAVTAAHNELAALKRKISQLDVQTDIRKERLGNLKGLLNGGLTTHSGVIITRSELSDIESRRQDSQLAITQVEARLAQAEQARERARLENAATLAKTIAATDAAIADLQQSLLASETVGSILRMSEARIAVAKADAPLRYEIVSRGTGGASASLADETSSLQPGDILKVGPQPPER
jgi:protein involved in polysaccharide export with SLBB domain